MHIKTFIFYFFIFLMERFIASLQAKEYPLIIDYVTLDEKRIEKKSWMEIKEMTKIIACEVTF